MRGGRLGTLTARVGVAAGGGGGKAAGHGKGGGGGKEWGRRGEGLVRWHAGDDRGGGPASAASIV